MVNINAVMVVFLCALTAATTGCAQDGARVIGRETETSMGNENGWREQAREVAGRVLYSFLASSTEKSDPAMKGMAPGGFEDVLRLRGRRFSNTHGWGVSVEFDGVEAEIALEEQIVVWFERRDDIPARRTREEQLVEQMQGQPSVSVGIDEAREAARLFVLEHVGAEVMDGLALSRGRLQHQAGITSYRFSWSNPPNDEQVRWGIRMIDVEVNPNNGEVFSFERTEAAVDGTPEISVEQARGIAARFFKAAEITAQITMLTYLDVPMREGGSFPVWAIRYEETIAMFQSIGSLFIDANTGDVVPDPGWLNDPGMAEPLQATRDSIKEISSAMQSGEE